MALLTKAAILGATDRPTTEVRVPEWDGSVRLRVITAAEREAISVAQKDGSVDEAGFSARLVAACVVDENGERLFTTEDDVRALAQKNAFAIERLFRAALALNRMTRESVEEQEKN